MKRITLILCGLIAAAVLPVAKAEPIEVKNTAGQAMTVEVMAFTPSSGNVRIKRVEDGQIFNVKIGVFDAESQKAIAENAPVARPDLEVDISVGRRRAREGDSSYMKRQEITVSAKVVNDSRDIDLAKSKFTLILVGRNMKRYANDNQDWSKILAKESWEEQLPAGREMKYEMKPVITAYDSDRDSSNIGGFEYDGYLMVIQDADGDVFDAYSNIGPVEVLVLKDPELLKKALKLEPGKEVQRNLQPLNKLDVIR